MIKLTNVSKYYGDRLVLDNINLSFPSRGLCVIYGPSGSGKTTLLNCLAGLTSFQGTIEVNRLSLSSMNDETLSKWRLSSVGFIFQDFKLFESETVWRNITFPLETLHDLPRNLRDRKCDDLLSLVSLKHKKKQIVNKLSGGEKQRVAIVRALINDPYVLLADEPTGALDQNTGDEVMRLLKKISQKSLVIMVSHDQQLTRQFADHIIEMEDGVITSVITGEIPNENISLPVIKYSIPKRKARVNLGFLFSHTFHVFQQKRWRTCISYGMTSLGLIGIGLAFCLSATISDNIKGAYRGIVGDNSMMVKLKNDGISNTGQYAANYYETSEIAEVYSDYIQGVGVAYYGNFEKFFPDSNTLAIVKDLSYRTLPNFSARHINEFIWLEDLKSEVYPKQTSELASDEIVLGLNIATLRQLCFELQIERTVKSLSEYLLRNDLLVYFDFANNEWAYSDQQLLKVVGFTLENDLCIYHSNHLWNEYIFEERMRFPTSDAISQQDREPWVLKKVYYLKTRENRDELINLLLEDRSVDKFILEIADEKYYPWLYYQKEISSRDRLLVFQKTIRDIPSWQIPFFMANDENLLSPIKGSHGGYLIFPDTLMVGFAKTIYFSQDKNVLEKIIDQLTTRSASTFLHEELPPYVLSGNYVNSLQGGVQFKTLDQHKVKGEKPQSIDEIVVSSAFLKNLNLKVTPVTVFAATARNETLTETGNIISDYALLPLKITGVIESNINAIYQHPNWTIMFYQCRVGISSFFLQTNSLCFPLKNPDKIGESLTKFQLSFPQYDVVNPLKDIYDSVDSVCRYISIALIIFSSVATFIAIILLTMCNYLYTLECKKDIALARCIGLSKSESRKFLYVNSLVQCVISFVLASIELVVMSVIMNMEINNALSISFSFNFNVLSLLPMLGLSLIIACISSLLISRRINKINPLDALVK